MPSFHQQVTFKSPSISVDSYGQRTGDSVTVSTKRATVRQLSGSERIAAAQVYALATWKVIIRYDSDILDGNNWTISYGSRVLEIGSIINVDERNRLLELLCSEVVTNTTISTGGIGFMIVGSSFTVA